MTSTKNEKSNFSLAFLVPAWCGRFSLGQIPLYFVWFDVMNCAGHCNFECFPRWAQWGPLKYYVYTSCYHSLHHSKYKYNYCLFCPIWDHLCGTAHPTSQALYREVTDRARARRSSEPIVGSLVSGDGTGGLAFDGAGEPSDAASGPRVGSQMCSSGRR